MDVVIENTSTETDKEKMPSIDNSKQTNESSNISNKLSENQITENISKSTSEDNLTDNGEVKKPTGDETEPVNTESVNDMQSKHDKVVEDLEKDRSVDSNCGESTEIVVEENVENQPTKDGNGTEDNKAKEKSNEKIINENENCQDNDKEIEKIQPVEQSTENVETDRKEDLSSNQGNTEVIEESNSNKEVVENNSLEEDSKIKATLDTSDEMENSKTSVNETEESKSAVKNVKNSAILESIASDWCFSDVENEVQECPVPTSVATKTTQEPKKTSAEMIAMEWDDSSQTAVEETAIKEKKGDVVIKTENENATESNEVKNSAHTAKSNSEEKTIICTVVENNQKDEKSSTNDENIIILHDLSDLNLDPSQNSGITIISVDENPNVPDSDSNKTSENNSYVIHEISINTADNTTEVTPPKIEDKPKATKGRKNKYPYVICSKEEITKEISQLKPSATDLPTGGDIIFKNQIIKRLASKILPKNLQSNDGSSESLSDEKPMVLDTFTNPKPKTVSDQELLEILEGDADIDIYNLPKEEQVIPLEKTPETTPHTTPQRGSKTKSVKQLDPEIEREIALRQLSEIPEGEYRARGRKGRNNNFVLTNVPSTVIIEKAEKTDADPFTFVENTKTVGTPSAYGPGTVKTYSRKSVTNEKEPNMKEIVQTIPKEILDLEKEATKTPRKNAKSSPGNKKQNAETTKSAKKKTEIKESVDKPSKAVENQVKKQKHEKIDNKIFLTDNTNNILISKRSRIIKKKIIWDPSLKFPTYVMPSITKGKVQKPKDKKQIITKRKLKTIAKTIKKDELLVDKKENVEILPENRQVTNMDVEEVIKRTKDVSEADVSNKRKSEHAQKRKKRFKRFSEIDKLLMDEGALNMLYSVEQDEKIPLIREKQKVISLDKFSKEMNKKKKMIMTALNTSPEGTPKALRKKDGTPTTMPPRKKSRDSARSPANTPPPSPNSMFPPRAEASRIIRRHSSSSSFSSECMSPRRLSTVDVNTEKSKTENVELNDKRASTTAEKTDTKEKPHPEKKMKMKMSQARNLRRRGVPIFIKKNQVNVYTGSKSKLNLKAKEIDYKKDDSKTEKEDNSATEQKIDRTIEKVETKENEVATPKSGTTKQSKKDLSIKNPSPTAESYSNVVKQLDADKKKDNDEKQRTSSRQNAGMYNYKEISIKRYDELVQIILTPQSTKSKNALNVQTMKEICDVLSSLKKDSTCKVILITSTGSTFCQGLDYTPLIQTSIEKRKAVAQEMANAVKDFVRAIIHFPRPVVAGVQGSASGLGVAILPLCDLVFVSDKAIFSMNQCKLGCLPEGAATVSLPYVTSHAVAAELLIAGHTLTANEALRAGLASRVLWPEGYFQELIPACKAIATQSSQSMDATKALTRHSLVMKIEAALDSETHLLVQHWTSSECQQLLKKTLEQDTW